MTTKAIKLTKKHATPARQKIGLIEAGDELQIEGAASIFVASGGGFGCNPAGHGSAVFGHWKDNGVDDRVERFMVTGITKCPVPLDEVERNKTRGKLDRIAGNLTNRHEDALELAKGANVPDDLLKALQEAHNTLQQAYDNVIKSIQPMDKYSVPANGTRTINGLLFTHEFDKDGDPKSNVYVEDCKDHSATIVCCTETGMWLSESQNILVKIPKAHMDTIKLVNDWFEGWNS